MKKNTLIFSFILLCLTCFAQKDTVMFKKQKGFLFLSSYNYLYDYTGGEIKNLGFHDFFYPSESFDIKCLLDSNKKIIFKNGLRVDLFNKRKQLKTRATSIDCIDTTNCYRFKNFYVVAVTIDYKLYEDYEPFICQRNFYELKVLRHGELRFEYLHRAISIVQVVENPMNKKK